MVIPGNTFDYSIIHGSSILKAGYSFYSVSDEYFCSDNLNPSDFKIIDLALGEEKTTSGSRTDRRKEFAIYTPEFMCKIKKLVDARVNIMMSGAYVGSDLSLNSSDSTAILFAANNLHFAPMTGNAVNSGQFYATDFAASFLKGKYTFNTGLSDWIYQVESPDAIIPAGKGSICAFRYSQNNTSAGILYNGKNRNIILGFPFETILSEVERDSLMMQILDFLSH